VDLCIVFVTKEHGVLKGTQGPHRVHIVVVVVILFRFTCD
jgi:hypothetical protein